MEHKMTKKELVDAHNKVFKWDEQSKINQDIMKRKLEGKKNDSDK